MSNSFFNASGNPATGSQGSSATMRSEFEAIEDGFDKLPTLTGNNSKIIAVNSGGSALEAVTTTGTGNAVRATSPTITTPTISSPTLSSPILDTPQSGTLTNCTGLPVSTGISGLGSNVATALAVNVGSSGAFVTNGGALGTPSSGTVTNLTGTASININGTVGATTPTTGAFTTVTASGVFTGPDGSASAPTYSFSSSGNSDNGMYLSGANEVSIATSGTNRFTVASNGNTTLNTSGNVTILTGGSVGTSSYVTVQDNSFPGYNRLNISTSRIWTDVTSSFPTNATLSLGAGSYTQAIYIVGSSGEVLVGGTTDQGVYNLQCNGTGVWGAGAYVNGSDSRIKEDVSQIDSGIDVVKKLNPVLFRYKQDWSSDSALQPGFIAQELQTALDGKSYINGVIKQGPIYLSVAYQSLIPILAKAIQEQQTVIENLLAEVEALKGN